MSLEGSLNFKDPKLNPEFYETFDVSKEEKEKRQVMIDLTADAAYLVLARNNFLGIPKMGNEDDKQKALRIKKEIKEFVLKEDKKDKDFLNMILSRDNPGEALAYAYGAEKRASQEN